MSRTPQQTLDHAAQFPYDASDFWWASDTVRVPPPAVDWAHAAARGVIESLTDRRGIKHAFEELDEDTRTNIVADLAAIIRVAAESKA